MAKSKQASFIADSSACRNLISLFSTYFGLKPLIVFKTTTVRNRSVKPIYYPHYQLLIFLNNFFLHYFLKVQYKLLW